MQPGGVGSEGSRRVPPVHNTITWEAVVQREMGRTITTVRSDEDSGEEKQGKWGKLSEIIW